MKEIPKARVERAARIYHNNRDAAQALGINPSSFARLCRRHNISTPYMRKRQRELQLQRKVA